MSPEQREALANAMRGDWEAADAMELAHLNASKEIRMRVLEQIHKPNLDDVEGIRAVELEHARGPASVTAVIWTLAGDCEDCDGEGELEVLGAITTKIDCPSCDGTGSGEDEDTARVRTDIDGNLLEQPE